MPRLISSKANPIIRNKHTNTHVYVRINTINTLNNVVMSMFTIGLSKFKVQNGANPEKKENNMRARM